jgi:uncharacterized repeat protein (TIGR01451 family)
MKLIRMTAVLAMAIILPTLAIAKAQLTISILAEKEVAGGKSKKRMPIKKSNPGDTIFYTINYKNVGNEPATNAVIDDPIPENTVYLPGSANGANSDITFSIDNGKTFKKPMFLTYEVKTQGGKTELRTATPEEYTHIRWTINSIPPGGSGQAGFQVKVK